MVRTGPAMVFAEAIGSIGAMGGPTGGGAAVARLRGGVDPVAAYVRVMAVADEVRFARHDMMAGAVRSSSDRT